MAGYWLAGFGVDYSTPAPGVGGEPLLAALLHERDGVKASASVAAVAMDRRLDAMINAAVLLAFSLLVIRWQIFHHHITIQAALVPAAILFILAAVLFPLFSGRRPFHWLGQRLPEGIRRSRLFQFLKESENKFATLLNTQRLELLTASVLSLIIWAAIMAEFWLIVFLGMRLNLQELVTAVTASRLAFLFPLPAGLGALEASLVFAFRFLGLKEELGLSAAIVIRVRDILFIAGGLLWGAWLLGGWFDLWETHRSSSAESKEEALSDGDWENGGQQER